MERKRYINCDTKSSFEGKQFKDATFSDVFYFNVNVFRKLLSFNWLQAALSACLVAVSGFPRPQAPAGPLPIPRPGSDGSYAGDNHFQYINVPAHKTFEWGYRRGNPHHNREEYLSQKDHTFKAKVRMKAK